MPRKVSKDMMCGFCGGDRDSQYVEIEVTLPDAIGPQRQLLGAHADCVTEAMSPGFSVEIDLLADSSSDIADGEQVNFREEFDESE